MRTHSFFSVFTIVSGQRTGALVQARDLVVGGTKVGTGSLQVCSLEGHKFSSFIITVTCLLSLNKCFTLPYLNCEQIHPK